MYYEQPFAKDMEAFTLEFFEKELVLHTRTSGLKSSLVSAKYMLGITEQIPEMKVTADTLVRERVMVGNQPTVRERVMVCNQPTEDDPEVDMLCSLCGWGTCTPDACPARSE